MAIITPTLLPTGLLLLWLIPTLAWPAPLYKWVDENGKIRYSDRLPARQAGRGFEKLSTEGVVVDKKAPAMTPEQKQRARKEARLRELEERRIARQKHHDRVLMMTYSNEDELREARDDRLEVVDAVINLLQRNIVSEQQKLELLKQEARERYSDKGQEVPGGLAQKIEYSTNKILSKQEQLLQKYNEQKQINEQFSKDLARYRELKQQQQDKQRKREELRRQAEELGLASGG